MISGHEDQDHLRISIRKLVKIFKVFDGFPISSKITIKTPDIDALQDVTMRGIQVIFQSECSQISFEILQPICFDYFIVTEGEWSIHLEALKDVLAILDPNLITAPSSAVQRGHIDHFFARATPSHELCHIHLDVEDSIFALEMKNTQDGLISKCKLALHTPIPLQDFEFSFSVDTKAVSFSLKSSLLVNAFTSIDDTCKFIEITIDRSASSKVTLKCDGMAGESIFSYSGAALSNFQSDVDNWSIDRENEISFTYYLSKFKDLVKTFFHTSVCNFEITQRGIMNIKSNMILDPSLLDPTLKQEIYIKSYIVPLENDEEEIEEEELASEQDQENYEIDEDE